MIDVDVCQYHPGEWVAVVTTDAVALLPATTPSTTLRALWHSLCSAGAADLVPHLQIVTAGLTSLPSFALLSVAGERLHAVVRGDVEVDVTAGGVARVLTAPHVSTWTEEVVTDVEHVAVRAPGVGGPVGDDGYPLVSGTVRAGAVLLRAPARVASATGLAPVAADPGGPDDHRAPVAPLAVVLPLTSFVPRSHGVPVGGLRPGGQATVTRTRPGVDHVPSPSLAGDPPVDDTLLRPSAPVTPVVVAPPAETVEAVERVEAVEQVEAAPGGADAAAATEREADVSADPLADHDGTTVLSAEVVALRAQLPDWAGHGVADPPAGDPGAGTVAAGRVGGSLPTRAAAPVAARVLVSTGDVAVLDRPVLLGRAPGVARVTSAQVPRLVTVPSPLQDISRTHAEVRMDGDDVVLTDLCSTNGVVVVRPHAAPQRLQPGEATVLQPGVLVDLGEGVTFTVERDA